MCVSLWMSGVVSCTTYSSMRAGAAHSVNSTCCLTIWGQTLRASLTGAEPTTDLSLATPLKTAGFVPFFLTRNTLLRRGTGVSLYDHIKRETFQTRTSASPQRQAQFKRASVEQQWTVVWWDAVRLYISKTNCPVLSAVTAHGAHSSTLREYKAHALYLHYK